MPNKKGLPRQLQGWMSVVKRVRDANPHLEYKDVLILAKPIYHKLKKQAGL